MEGPVGSGLRAAEEPLIGDKATLEGFSRNPCRGSLISAELRGVLAEIALAGIIRYDWSLVKPLLHSLLDRVLTTYAAEEQEQHHTEVGPPPLPGGKPLQSLSQALHDMLDGFSETPFTIQRLCELLLEPKNQYQKLDKLVAALEKLLLVTSTVPVTEEQPPRPSLASLAVVNGNPASPYMPCNTGSNAQQSSLLANGPQSTLLVDRADDKSTHAVFHMFMTSSAEEGARSEDDAGNNTEGVAALSTNGGRGQDSTVEDVT